RMFPPRRFFPVGPEGLAPGSAPGSVGGTGTGQPAASRPADPEPPTTASGLVGRRPSSRSPFPDLEGPPPGAAGPPGSESGEDEDEGEGDGRPMYSWNPSDTTEAFPAVPPPGDSHPG
ncbi:MAG: hypothetical protein ACR2MP_28965, partial [Streptosporangiaceae bacterium]